MDCIPRWLVSVPLRGLWFLLNSLRTIIKMILHRFRPLTGIMVLIWKVPKFSCWLLLRFRPLTGIMVLMILYAYEKVKLQSSFPSPYGDYGSYCDDQEVTRRRRCLSFRPLTGIMVLMTSPSLLIPINFLVSVPLRGLWFLFTRPWKLLR